ncbi:MAG: hypothetical protein DDG60_07770 [Anaerolineae bacterium]|nr:MAG: hypothetical protein DDG60_07770 [Anaerolineae bacterium]
MLEKKDDAMIGDLTRGFTLVILLFWLLFYWQGGLKIWTDIRSALRSKVSQLDVFLLMMLAFWGSMMTVTTVVVIFARLEIGSHSALSAVGLLLTLVGAIGTFYSRAVLGKFWTAEITQQPGHALVDSGPYRVVRHPIYFFAILLYWGVGLAVPVWWNWLAAIGITLGYALKAWEEEAFLERTLATYREYKQRVRYRLFPGVW